jgi:integrase
VIIGDSDMASYFITKKVLKSKQIRYTATITHKSRNYRTKTFRLKQDAKEWACRFITDVDKLAAAGKRPCDITFSQLADEYLANWTGKDTSRVQAVEKFSVHFGDIRIDKITTDDCRELLRKWDAPDEYAPATYNKYRAILSAIFKFSCEQNEESARTYISDNPVKTIRNKRLDNQRVRFLSDDEKQRLVGACKEIGGKFYLYFLIALSCGMRKGKVSYLRWIDVDFSRGLLMIGKDKNGYPIHTPLPEAVMMIMASYREVGSGFIFPSTTNLASPFDFKKKWNRARKMAEIENFKWHDLRHDTASTLARDGRTLLEIAEILGHKSLQSTKRYAHLSTGHKSRILSETMERSLSKLL